MRPIYLLASLALLIFVASSCKKDTTPDPFGLTAGKLSMKADGTLREAETAFVFTAHEEETDHYIVALTGMFNPQGSGSSEDVVDAFYVYMSFTAAQFNNPKGTYDIIALDSDPEGRPLVYATYQVGMGSDAARIYGIAEANKSIGKLTITGFEIGNQTGIPGLSGRGYTKLQGTFQMTLSELKMDGSGFVGEFAITEGKFDVKDQFAFGF